MMFTPIKTVAIVGAGAIGTYYGARLALAGSDVRFLMRSDLEAVRSRGSILLHERSGILVLKPVTCFASAQEIGVVDLVLVTLKTTSNPDLREILPALVGPKTAVVTLQNGLGNEDYLAGIVSPEQILGGLCFIAVVRSGPGELKSYHTPGHITLGEFKGPGSSERSRAIAALISASGVPCQVVDSLLEARWRKLIWNIPFNGLSIAAGGIATDRILADPVMAAEIRALMDEVALAASAQGFVIPESFIQGQIDVTPPMGAYQPSSLIDFLAGKEVEIEAIWGEPLRRARALGVPTPRLSLLYSVLRQRVRR